ncbi:unnamed protein product [marine sediment metagenome]|uniref:HTH cro/C1-type domain-containing protein n=1 Tax=marine sediment metagenome TaxID=412755 RepID=X1QFH5_9ZZZZ
MEKIRTVNRIRAIRQTLQLTQQELGKVLSEDYRKISDWEREKTCPDLETKQRIAKALGCPLSVVFPGG